MKKKILYSLMTLIAVTFMSVTFSSCSDDDEPKLEDAITPDPTNPAITGDHDPEVIGTWQYNDENDDYGKKIVINYRSDGRYYETEQYWEYYQGEIEYDDPYWESGYWATDGDYLYVYCTNSCDEGDVGDSGTYRYSVDSGTLYLNYREYTRQ